MWWFFLIRPFAHYRNPHMMLWYDSVGYIAIPKNANSTINGLLMSALGISYEKTNYNSIHERRPQFAISRYQFQKYTRSGAFTFSFARNPFARMVSCYVNKVATEDFYAPSRAGGVFPFRRFFRKGISFETFVKRVCLLPDSFTDVHLQSQSYFLFHKDEPLFSYLGHVESFDNDILPILKRVGVPTYTPYNVSTAYDWRSYYTPALARAVHKRYREDFERLGYADALDDLLRLLDR